jgi:hypothetical protein
MNLGSRPIGDMQYDKITAFTVNLSDQQDRKKVSDQLIQFIDEVNAEYALSLSKI